MLAFLFLRPLRKDVISPVKELRILIIDPAEYRKMSPLHCVAHREQADRRAGIRYFFPSHVQINLVYKFFAAASRSMASLRFSSSCLISASIISTVRSEFIQGFALMIAW